MLIKLNIDKIDQATITDLINFHSNNLLPRYKHLQDYYEGRHDILNKKVEDEGKPNNKLVNDYPGYIVDLITGYFMGKPVVYSSKSSNDTYLKTLQDIFDYNDESDENAELAKTCSIKGEAFELVYLDQDSNIRFTKIDNEQTILVYGTEVEVTPVLGIRYYKLYTLNSLDETEETIVEVYTKNTIGKYKYNDGELTVLEEKEHFFKEVPIIHYLNNEEVQGNFEKVISLIDAYDKQQSNTQNDFDYFTDAYLKLKNMSGTETSDVNTMKENRIILVEGDGDADWLIKNINDAALENYKNRLNKDIHKFSDVPDLSDENFAGDLSGVAIRFKLFCLEQIAAMKERKFKKALQRRIELITNILNIKGGNYIYTDIDMSFTRNIPANLTEIVNMVTQLKGTLSEETLVSQLPFVIDVQAEMDKIKQEQESTLNYNIQQTNTSNNTNGDVNE